MRLFFLLIPFFLFASDFIVKYENLKPFYYKNQIVNLKFKVVSPKPNLMFLNDSKIDLNITQINPYIYQISAKFKADDSNKTITLYTNDEQQKIYLNKKITIKNLPKIKNFSGVLAEKFNIINPISSEYENNKTILSFTIKCVNCNIEDFKLNKDENLTVVSQNEATYYTVLPKTQKKLTFYYYNTKQNRFEKETVPVILKEETISTQTDINPSENKIFTPLNIMILVLIAIGIVIFLIYQKIWLLIFPLLLSIYLIIQLLPKGNVILKKGTKVQILPTKNSTVFYIVKKETNAKILNKKGNYIKIKINNKIGWINENN